MNSRLQSIFPLYAIKYAHQYYKADYRSFWQSFNPNAIIRTLRDQYYRQFPLQWLIKFHGELNPFARATAQFPACESCKINIPPVMWAFAWLSPWHVCRTIPKRILNTHFDPLWPQSFYLESFLNRRPPPQRDNLCERFFLFSPMLDVQCAWQTKLRNWEISQNWKIEKLKNQIYPTRRIKDEIIPFYRQLSRRQSTKVAAERRKCEEREKEFKNSSRKLSWRIVLTSTTRIMHYNLRKKSRADF